jgi:hypothetical protein
MDCSTERWHQHSLLRTKLRTHAMLDKSPSTCPAAVSSLCPFAVRSLATLWGCDETHRTRLPSTAWSAVDSGIEHVDDSSDGLVGLGRGQHRCWHHLAGPGWWR